MGLYIYRRRRAEEPHPARSGCPWTNRRNGTQTLQQCLSHAGTFLHLMIPVSDNCCCVIGSGGVVQGARHRVWGHSSNIKASQTSCLLSRTSLSRLVLVALLPRGTIVLKMWTAATPRLVVLAASSPGGEAAEPSGSKTFIHSLAQEKLQFN